MSETTAETTDTTTTATPAISTPAQSVETPAADTPAIGEATTDPAAPSAPTPEQIAAQEREAARKERQDRLRKIAENKANEWRASEELRKAKERARQAESARQADLERARLAERYERVEQDPDALLAYLRERGIGVDKIKDLILKEGQPETVAARIAREAEARAEAKIREWEERRAAEEMHASKVAAVRNFVTTVQTAKTEDGADKYPALTLLYTPHQLAVEIDKLATAAAKRGHAYTDDEWAEFLEEREKPRYNKLRERLHGAAQSSHGKSNPAGTGTQSARAPAMTSTTSSGGLPANFSDLSDEEQDKILLSRWRQQQGR